jgi:hypothetical protein
MHQHQIDNINARTCWETIGLRDEKTIIVLVVETELILNPETTGFDADLYQELREAVREYVAMQTHIDTVAFYKIGDH